MAPHIGIVPSQDGAVREVMAMSRVPGSYAVVALAVLAAAAGAVLGACPGDGPEVVLDCFSRAYSERDPDVLEEVLADDYMWVAVAPPKVDVFTREHSVASSVRMFRNQEIELVSLEFRDGYHVKPGKEPKTWRIENLLALLTVKQASVVKPSIARLCVTLYVRETAQGTPGYEVYREVFFEGEGCVKKPEKQVEAN